jgi:DNA-binding SARP family transcriptional activator
MTRRDSNRAPTEQHPVHLEIRLLGTFQVTLNGKPLEGIRSDKTRALLAYLAVEVDQPHSREVLCTLLWGEHAEKAARASLRSSLSNLRRLLIDQQGSSLLLDFARYGVQLDIDSNTCWVDTAEFNTLIDACNVHAHQDLAHCPLCLSRLERAVALYQGDFLTGLPLTDTPVFNDWYVIQQERYHRYALWALETLATHFLSVGDYIRAQEYGQRQIALEPWREEAHQQLMQALALDGQRSAALAQYETCKQLLAEELGVEPTPETEMLYEGIRSGALMPQSWVNDVPGKLETWDGTRSFDSQVPPGVSDALRLATSGRQDDDSVVWITLRADAKDLTKFFHALHGALNEVGGTQLQAFLSTGARAPIALVD